VVRRRRQSERNTVELLEAAVIGTGWCGGIRAETLALGAVQEAACGEIRRPAAEIDPANLRTSTSSISHHLVPPISPSRGTACAPAARAGKAHYDC
jgi:hypothetical protein